ncbi:putative bifunctional diguanylate cyclase/phosphodiesterase [Parageobacillus thermoglucosidasius]|uniref:putative bifunctional diguanylate cyclase/phosphodiesterase n=1 Tax=Parageobacillus thermoglucosidasius TaxID=1426 RepID=UPI0021AB4663|nr:EAL domain-containing protein [Parageobacillus thermoglucosidasius]MED4903390.1 EAL domain-containing protein [Parageobacillus thermoglucosidasius]MED4912901.1 EAL domain-containing protein [Parageobacillus thermoglucosidasius]MED4945291.1 EAL domain-containing protein [Parageobacillus thermoglucosidasius]MED4984505.1 EAL domain-containing protein [Parageobacillus thermoglucosidasius]
MEVHDYYRKLIDVHTFAGIAKNILEYSSESMIVTDAQNRILFVNPAFEIVTGYSADEVIGKNPRILQSGMHDKTFYEKMWNALNQYGVWKGEIWNKRKDGELYLEWLTISAVKDQQGNVTNYVAIFSDITEHKRNMEQLTKLALYDPLTNVPNRYLFEKRLESIIRMSKKHNQSFALLFLDLDRFKNINDTLGHHMGDMLLKETAQRLNGMLRKQDTIARFGGDEFVIILPNLKHIREAVYMAENIIESLKRPFNVNHQEVYISTSIGISVYPYDGTDKETLIRMADRAMYQAKTNGRNQFVLYHDGMNNNGRHLFQLETALRKAFDLGEFALYYQPQVDMKTKQIRAVEALIRWNHHEKGVISPGQFIPLAEESGLITPISDWIIMQACEDLKQLQWQFPYVKMSINISPIYFQQIDFLEKLQKTIESVNVNPRSLELELTESAIMPHAEQSVGRLTTLKTMGISIAIDDFGTGFSSLSYLHRFPIDVLKIDQSFIKQLSQYQEDLAIVKAIIMMAHSLQIQVVAEGVETEKQYQILEEQRCDFVQGYYVSNPLTIGELYGFLDMWNHFRADQCI